MQTGTGGQQAGGEGAKSACSSHSRQKGLMTSRPKEEGHFTGKHVTSAVAASQWQNLKNVSVREGRAEVEQSNEAMTLI